MNMLHDDTSAFELRLYLCTYRATKISLRSANYLLKRENKKNSEHFCVLLIQWCTITFSFPFQRGLRFMMQSSPLCQAGIQSRLCLHYFPMVSISLWDNLTCNPRACSLSSLRQNRPLNRRRIQVTGVFYPLTRRKQPPRASGAE